MSRRGHSLIELVVAFGLVGLLVLFVLSLFPGVNRALRGRDDLSRAESLARQALEEAAAAETTPPLGQSDVTPQDEEQKRFARTLVVAAVPGHDAAILLKLTVTVRWDREGQPRVLERSRYRYQLQN